MSTCNTWTGCQKIVLGQGDQVAFLPNSCSTYSRCSLIPSAPGRRAYLGKQGGRLAGPGRASSHWPLQSCRLPPPRPAPRLRRRWFGVELQWPQSSCSQLRCWAWKTDPPTALAGTKQVLAGQPRTSSRRRFHSRSQPPVRWGRAVAQDRPRQARIRRRNSQHRWQSWFLWEWPWAEQG